MRALHAAVGAPNAGARESEPPPLPACRKAGKAAELRAGERDVREGEGTRRWRSVVFVRADGRLEAHPRQRDVHLVVFRGGPFAGRRLPAFDASGVGEVDVGEVVDDDRDTAIRDERPDDGGSVNEAPFTDDNDNKLQHGGDSASWLFRISVPFLSAPS